MGELALRHIVSAGISGATHCFCTDHRQFAGQLRSGDDVHHLDGGKGAGILEEVCGEFHNLARHTQGLQVVAIGKQTFLQGSNAFGQDEVTQSMAVCKCIRTHERHVGQYQRLHAHAVIECVLTHATHGVGNLHRGQRATVHKQAIVDLVETGRQFYLGDSVVALKQILCQLDHGFAVDLVGNDHHVVVAVAGMRLDTRDTYLVAFAQHFPLEAVEAGATVIDTGIEAGAQITTLGSVDRDTVLALAIGVGKYVVAKQADFAHEECLVQLCTTVEGVVANRAHRCGEYHALQVGATGKRHTLDGHQTVGQNDRVGRQIAECLGANHRHGTLVDKLRYDHGVGLGTF